MVLGRLMLMVLGLVAIWVHDVPFDEVNAVKGERGSVVRLALRGGGDGGEPGVE